MLSYEKVKEIHESPVCKKMEWARKYNDKLLVHVEGVGLQEYLSRINNYENKNQFIARKKHAISNKFLTEELLRPVDNAFHARGGSKNYKFKSGDKTDELVEKLVNVKHGSSLSDYIENVWFDKFVTDPNGLIFMEVQINENEIEDTENILEPTYKNIHSIKAYEQNGINVDWVVFEPHLELKEDDEEVKQFWAVDESFYYLYEESEDGLKLIKSLENTFGKVPAILCSNIIHQLTGWKKSPIDSQIELLDKYVVSNSVLNIAEFFHNYPREWTYVDECNTCNGTGNVSEKYDNGGFEDFREVQCSSCDGTGKATKKDVTDITELRIPDADGQKIDPPSGFTYMPTEPWELMTKSVDRTWDIIYFSHWGTTVSKDSKNETATGRFLDAQPVNNRLNKYSKSMELAHTSLVNLVGEFYFPETFERAVIQYGRRYLIETPDQIWDKYLTAKKDNAPVTTLDLLLSQFIESEFRENEQMFIYEMKKVKLEPFVHWDILTVQKLGVNQIDYFKKLYFSDWIQTKELKYVIQTDINVLNEELTVFATEKQGSTNINLNNNNNE